MSQINDHVWLSSPVKSRLVEYTHEQFVKDNISSEVFVSFSITDHALCRPLTDLPRGVVNVLQEAAVDNHWQAASALLAPCPLHTCPQLPNAGVQYTVTGLSQNDLMTSALRRRDL